MIKCMCIYLGVQSGAVHRLHVGELLTEVGHVRRRGDLEEGKVFRKPEGSYINQVLIEVDKYGT